MTFFFYYFQAYKPYKPLPCGKYKFNVYHHLKWNFLPGFQNQGEFDKEILEAADKLAKLVDIDSANRSEKPKDTGESKNVVESSKDNVKQESKADDKRKEKKKKRQKEKKLAAKEAKSKRDGEVKSLKSNEPSSPQMPADESTRGDGEGPLNNSNSVKPLEKNEAKNQESCESKEALAAELSTLTIEDSKQNTLATFPLGIIIEEGTLSEDPPMLDGSVNHVIGGNSELNTTGISIDKRGDAIDDQGIELDDEKVNKIIDDINVLVGDIFGDASDEPLAGLVNEQTVDNDSLDVIADINAFLNSDSKNVEATVKEPGQRDVRIEDDLISDGTDVEIFEDALSECLEQCSKTQESNKGNSTKLSTSEVVETEDSALDKDFAEHFKARALNEENSSVCERAKSNEQPDSACVDGQQD